MDFDAKQLNVIELVARSLGIEPGVFKVQLLKAINPKPLPAHEPQPKPQTDSERFWSRVSKTETCWLWEGSKGSKGYGQLGIQGKSVKAHRYSWSLANGEIPEGMTIDHICHVVACVNPDHLRLATQKQNCENTRLSVMNKTGYRGVSMDRGRYRAQVKHAGKKIYLGLYDTAEEAGEVARKARNDLFTHNNLDRKEAA